MRANVTEPLILRGVACKPLPFLFSCWKKFVEKSLLSFFWSNKFGGYQISPYLCSVELIGATLGSDPERVQQRMSKRGGGSSFLNFRTLHFLTKFKSDMKQITFSDAQWALLTSIVGKEVSLRYNSWYAFKDAETSLYLAGMEDDQFRGRCKVFWNLYETVKALQDYMKFNAREIEEKKA